MTDDDKAIRKALREGMKDIFGEFPDGKLNPTDEGGLMLAIVEEHGRIVIRFPKKVAWIGFSPDQAVEFAQLLISRAISAGTTKPVVIKVGKR